MTNTPKPKIITVLGVGGHGSSAFDDLLNHHQNDIIHLVLGSDDDGGHSGFVREILPFMNVPGNISQYTPMGDLRSIIERFLFYNVSDEASKKFGARFKTRDINEFTQRCREFCSYFGFDQLDECEGFIDFCRNYFSAALQTEIDLDVNHCIGNLFLSYNQMLTGFNQGAFFDRLKAIHLIPGNIFPHFFYNRKLMLEGKNLNTNTPFKKESDIDVAPIPISPSTLELTDEYTKEKVNFDSLKLDNPELISILEQSETILLSTGSIANLFGQLNILAPYLKDYPGLILWLGNIARTRNEADFVEILLYFLAGLHLEGVVLQMNDNDFQNIIRGGSDWLRLYQDQGKDFVNIKSMMDATNKILNFNGFLKTKNLIQPILGVTVAAKNIGERIKGWEEMNDTEKAEMQERLGNGGIKYITSEVTLFVDFFSELYNFWLREVGIDNKHQRYELISEQLGRLKFAEKSNEQIVQEVEILREILNSPIDVQDKARELDNAINQFAGITETTNEIFAEEHIEVK